MNGAAAITDNPLQRGLMVWLVDARQMKYMPCRRSDVQDSQWPRKQMSLGLLRTAWRPGDEVCVVRAVDLTRINGLSVTTVMTVLSEIGPDLIRLASVTPFCS